MGLFGAMLVSRWNASPAPRPAPSVATVAAQAPRVSPAPTQAAPPTPTRGPAALLPTLQPEPTLIGATTRGVNASSTAPAPEQTATSAPAPTEERPTPVPATPMEPAPTATTARPTAAPALPTLAPPTATAPLPPPTIAPPPTVVVAGLTRPGPVLTATRLDRAPSIDGRLDEWSGPDQAISSVVYGAENYSGPDDLSGRVWLGWDDQALYVAALVFDDVVSQSNWGNGIYQGDSLELQWDTDLAGDFNADTFNADDWHIGLSPGNFTTLGPDSYVWSPRAISGAAAGIQVEAQSYVQGGRRAGYALEAAIPWSLVNIRPRAAQTFGLTVAISDDDLPQPVQQSMLATSPTRQWHRPSTFNTLVLR